MFLGNLALLVLVALCKRLTKESPESSVKRLVFNNKDGVMCVDFDGPIIIENVQLLKKVNNSDSTAVKILNDDIIYPEDYMSKVQKVKQTDVNDEDYKRTYQDACCKQIKIELDKNDFKEDDVYLLMLHPLNTEDNDLYTEEFVYSNGKYGHKSSSHSHGHRWYASSWPWIAIAFIILSAILLLLLLRLLCCPSQ